MRILLTGATGYIGKRLLPLLLEEGHHVICCVRNIEHFEQIPHDKGSIELFQVDFLEAIKPELAPKDFDIAYYLIHSMSNSIDNFEEMEIRAAKNFRDYLDQTSAQQIIYLTGMANSDHLSKHLSSRLRVEETLDVGKVPLTALRAGIVIGSGSASFEIIRDLVEKLPLMITPRWLHTRCQPIAIRDVLQFLLEVKGNEKTFGKNYDIGGADILSYKAMLLGYAKVRNLKRWIFTLPIMTPRLSSYWLYFVTSTTYPLAVNLVNSMKIDVVARNNDLAKQLDIDPIAYGEAVRLAFQRIEQNSVISSWKDALISSFPNTPLQAHLQVPQFGCFKDEKAVEIEREEISRVWANICAIGGERGWYYGNWLWKIRGFLDKLVGGIGLRRGRTHRQHIHAGDALDFWRVMVVDEDNLRLLLFAEMKLPGEAWLEFSIQNIDGEKTILLQKATFRPHGVFGRLYWFSVLPFHYFVFNGMIRNLAKFNASDHK